MLRVTVQLLPGGDESKPETLGVAYIINDGTGTNTTGYYKTAFSQRGGKRWWKKGSVDDFPRLQRNAWDLLYLALKGVVGERNE